MTGVIDWGETAPEGLRNPFTSSSPTRALDTNYTPSATRPSYVINSIEITCTSTITVLGGTTQSATVEWHQPNGTHKDSMGQSSTFSGTVLVGVAVTNTQVIRGIIGGWVPTNAAYRMVSTISGATVAVSRTTEWVF